MHGKSGTLDRPWLGILEGIALATATSVAGVLIFALILKFFNVSDGVIPIVNQAIKVAMILLGTWRAVRRGARGLVGGLLVGVGYIALGIAVFSLVEGALAPVGVMLGDLALGSAAGGVSGIMLANILKK